MVAEKSKKSKKKSMPHKQMTGQLNNNEDTTIVSAPGEFLYLYILLWNEKMSRGLALGPLLDNLLGELKCI